MAAKTVNPAVQVPLQEALATAYWFKSDLRTFLASATGLSELVDRYDWNNNDVSKRQIVRHFVTTLFENQHVHQDALVALLVATPDIDPSRLKRLDDGAAKYASALAALSDLRALVEPYRKLHSEAAQAEQRFRIDREQARREQDHSAQIADLRTEFIDMHALAPQARGYELERFMTRLFDVHDIDARGPFTGDGEQIDGAFTFDGADYLLEAKWQQEPSNNTDISIFRDKIRRRLENTLGLFVSFSGFQQTVLSQSGRSGQESVLLMDGPDLMAVLDGHLRFEEMFRRKKQHAARTGKIMLHAADIINGT